MAGNVQRNERIVKDVERQANHYEAKFSLQLRETAATLTDAHSSLVQDMHTLDQRLSSLIQSESGQQTAALIQQTDRWSLALEEQISILTNQIGETRVQGEKRVVDSTSHFEKQLGCHVTDMEGRFVRQAQELESRFGTFKGSVANSVGDFNKTMLVLNDKVDELSLRISHILKTIVIT
jgi:hypothetical protein